MSLNGSELYLWKYNFGHDSAGLSAFWLICPITNGLMLNTYVTSNLTDVHKSSLKIGAQVWVWRSQTFCLRIIGDRMNGPLYPEDKSLKHSQFFWRISLAGWHCILPVQHPHACLFWAASIIHICQNQGFHISISIIIKTYVKPCQSHQISCLFQLYWFVNNWWFSELMC